MNNSFLTRRNILILVVTSIFLFLPVAASAQQDSLLYVGFENTDIGSPDKIAITTGPVVYNAGYSGQGRQLAEATTNLIKNPSFEVDYSTWNFAGWDSYSIVPNGIVGSNALRLYDATSGGYVYIQNADAPPVTPAAAYTLSVYIKKLIATGTGQLLIIWLDASNNSVGTPVIVNMDIGTHDWKRYAASGTAPSGAVKASIYSIFYLSGSTADIMIDGVQFEEKPYATPYCDGSLNGHSWSGAAHASTSSRLASTLSYTNPIQAINSSSLSLWWKPAANNAGPTRYLWDEGNLKAYFNAADDKVYFSDGGNTIATTPLTFNANVWQHLVFNWSIWDGLKIYQNGTLAASGLVYTPPTLGPDLYVGSDINGNYQADGLIDELEVVDQQSIHSVELDSGKTILAPIQATLGQLIIAGIVMTIVAGEGLYLILGVVFK